MVRPTGKESNMVEQSYNYLMFVAMTFYIRQRSGFRQKMRDLKSVLTVPNFYRNNKLNTTFVELVRNLVAHGDAQEGKWRGNWRMECVASTLTPLPNVVYPALLKLMRTHRLPAVDWTDAPTDLNGLVRFGERRNLVSARVPSRSARAIRRTACCRCK